MSHERTVVELREELKRAKSELTRRAYCLERGWKTLCRNFRRFMNKKAGGPPENSNLYQEWMQSRITAAKEFIRENDIQKFQASELIAHVGILKMRGYRRCMRCHTVKRI